MKQKAHRKPPTLRTSTARPRPSLAVGRTGGVRLSDLHLEPQAPARWPSISACLIVKNEAENLGPCLRSLGDLAAEILVVDTGSADGTPEIARSLGAAVHSFPWIDDFAAARNESLRHATKDWVFWLDADDRLSPEAVAQLERAAASGLADAYMCMVASKKPNGSRDVVEHIRLFRNGLGLRFSGAIHENVYPDLARLGLRLARTDIEVEHVGYEDAEAIRRKAARNLAVIDRELALAPGRVDLIFYRGHSRRAVGDAEGAEADMRDYLARTLPGVTFDWTRFWAHAALAFLLGNRKDLEALEPLLRRALAEFPDHPHFLVELAQVQLALGLPEDALRGLRSAQERSRGTVRGLRPADAWIEAGIAECGRAMGHAEAEESASRVQAARVLARTRTRTGTPERVVRSQMEGLALLARGELLKAAECLAEAIQATPSDPDNYRYLAVALQGLGQEEQAMEAWRLSQHWLAQAGRPS